MATRFTLGMLTLVLVGYVAAQNVVIGRVFVAGRAMGSRSPWVREFWPPLHVYPPERCGAGNCFLQRIALSPVTIRVRTPRSFQSVEIDLEASGIPGGSTVGVERALHTKEYNRAPFVDGRASLSLADVVQEKRDLQFQFIFPGTGPKQPVTVSSITFTFRR